MNSVSKISILEAENAAFRVQVKEPESKVILLLEIIEKQGVKKDSHNSHNPPSTDKSNPKRNKSLRKKTGRKTGGQKGHEGHTLEMKNIPDEVEDLKSNYCGNCGLDLIDLGQELLSKRQEIILPPILPQYKEYRQYGYLCDCGHHQKADYP
jgi:hypothetical protein